MHAKGKDRMKLFGSYMGEVYRKHHSGEWEISPSVINYNIGTHDSLTGTYIWLWGRVYNRILARSLWSRDI